MGMQEVRVIDPILSKHARGYNNAEFVGHKLFPRVTVNVSGGKVIEFGKEAFMRYSTSRAPGGATKRINFGYAGKPYALENHSLEALVPIEKMRDAKNVPNIDLAARALQLVQRVMGLELEVQQATTATTASNYDASNVEVLTGAGSLAAITNLVEWMDAKKELIRSQTAQYPNVLLIGAKVFAVMRSLAQVKKNFEMTTSATVTPEMLAQFFDIPEVVVGRSVMADQDGKFIDAWGNDMVLAFVGTGSVGAEEPSYGYTYEMEGHPAVASPYYEENLRSWVYGVDHERAPVIAGAGAAALTKNVG